VENLNIPKYHTAEHLAEISAQTRGQGRKLVFTNGCFDLLHVGHVRYLQEARQRGDALLVAINSDNSVRSLKGPGRPIVPQDERAEVLAALECVDYVTVFEEARVTGLLERIQPQVYVKGGDYQVEELPEEEREAARKAGAVIEVLGVVPGRSTTALLEKTKQ
jgi:rfaE bifunctional protein nucleotidyltransferase chain/domain